MSAHVYRASAERSQGLRLDVKRCHVPFVLKASCPRCSEAVEHDFTDAGSGTYLTYPPVGEPFERELYCHVCEHEWNVKLVLGITLKAAREDDGT